MAEKKKKEKPVNEEAAKAEVQPEKAEKKEPDELSLANDRFLRLAADFDNYKKRTAAEKENLRAAVVSDTVTAILPIIDNLERALEAAKEDSPLKDGVQMVLNQAKTSFDSLGITSYGQRGDEFDPEIHNAVMTCADEDLEPNQIADVLQKGYKIGDKIIRHALVRVTE